MSSNGTRDPMEVIAGFYFARLIPRSEQGRALIIRYGSAAWVIGEAECCPRSEKAGPWLKVALGEHSFRWIHAIADPHFSVEMVNTPLQQVG